MIHGSTDDRCSCLFCDRCRFSSNHRLVDITRPVDDDPIDRNLLSRINASRPILHALLVSSLEGAWDTAVALQTRGFGCGARSAAPAPPWRRADRVLAFGAALSLAATGAGLVLGKGAFVFYPRLGRLCIAADLPWLFAAAAPLAAAVALARRAAR